MGRAATTLPSDVRWRRRRRAVVTSVVAALVAAFAAAAVGACGPSTTINGAPLPAGSANTAALPTLSVQQSDVPPDFTVALYPNGDKVQGEVTLDLCSADYTSEALRVARRQVAVVDAQQRVVVSTEAVGYVSEAATAQGFAELRAAAAHCPTDFVPSTDPSLSPVKTVFNPAPDSGWPLPAGIERLAFDLTLTDQDANTVHEEAIYFRRGRILLGVYLFFVPDEALPAVDGQATAQGISGVFATRLSQLAASVVK